MILYTVIALVMLFVLIVASMYQTAKVTVTKNNNFSETNLFYNKILFCCIIFVLCFLTAFRCRNIGNDTPTYLMYFARIKQFGTNKNYAIELGYQYYCLFLGKLTNNENAILIITAIFCYLGVGFYALKYSDNLMFSLVLIFSICFSIFTNILRQSIAMVICLYAYQALKIKKHLIFTLLVLLASTFHTSALLLFVLALNKFFPKNIIIIFIATIIIAFLSATNVIAGLLRSMLTEYDSYFDGERVNTGWTAITYELLRSYVFCLVAFKAYKNNLNENKLILANFTLFVIVNALGYSVNLFSRASEYFLLISITELPNAMMKFNGSKRSLLIFTTGLIMLAYFFVAIIFRPEWNHLYPYEFWK